MTLRHECLIIGDMETSDMLEKVVAELQRRDGQMRRVAAESGIAYDTVLRIKNREGAPAYSRVKTLHDYLFDKAAA